ncbi:MAG TPA: hypothetical protein VHM20_06295 [Gammaproteobacteria bacterium]|jgi:hypothetical protein|nr:hypothetical protein [Gammaproteobacteria bacterium]
MLRRLTTNIAPTLGKSAVKSFSTEAPQAEKIAEKILKNPPSKKGFSTTAFVLGVGTASAVTAYGLSHAHQNKLQNLKQKHQLELSTEKLKHSQSKTAMQNIYAACKEHPILSLDHLLSFGDFYGEKIHIDALLWKIRNSNVMECRFESAQWVATQPKNFFEVAELSKDFDSANKMQGWQRNLFIKHHKRLSPENVLTIPYHETSSQLVDKLLEHPTIQGPEVVDILRHFDRNAQEKILNHQETLDLVIYSFTHKIPLYDNFQLKTLSILSHMPLKDLEALHTSGAARLKFVQELSKNNSDHTHGPRLTEDGPLIATHVRSMAKNLDVLEPTGQAMGLKRIELIKEVYAKPAPKEEATSSFKMGR